MNEKLNYASLKSRIGAMLIDMGFFCLIFFPITYLVKGVWIMAPNDHRWSYGLFITDPLCIGFLIFMIIYYILLEAYLGVTLGKFIMGIKVVAINGTFKMSRVGLKKSIIRNGLRVIDSLPTLSILGMILISRSPERARFGDEKAGTRVLKIRGTV